MRRADQVRFHFGQPALRIIGMRGHQSVAHHKAENRVAQKLQLLVVAGRGAGCLLVNAGPMRERARAVIPGLQNDNRAPLPVLPTPAPQPGPRSMRPCLRLRLFARGRWRRDWQAQLECAPGAALAGAGWSVFCDLVLHVLRQSSLPAPERSGVLMALSRVKFALSNLPVAM